MNVSCDSFRLWLNENEKVFVNKITVLGQIGMKDSLILKSAANSNEIYLHDRKKTYTVKRIDIPIANKKTIWTVYFTDELKEILFVEIKSENPNSIIYFKPQAKKILYQLVADSSFILNKFKISKPMKFIPPPTSP